jgi:hypothetical protein
MKKDLTKDLLKEAAKEFCEKESTFDNKDLYGVTDGKAVGTYIENKFQEYLSDNFSYLKGNAARGIDLPGEVINTDIKVTSRNRPQSSCPFKNAKQKIFGLGYNLLVFVYNKTDNHKAETAILDFVSCTFLEKERTADYTTTFRLREMVDDGANKEDIIAYLNDRNIPAEDIMLDLIAEKVLSDKPTQGYLTISNALQWRLQYTRVVGLTDSIVGISKLVDRMNL